MKLLGKDPYYTYLHMYISNGSFGLFQKTAVAVVTAVAVFFKTAVAVVLKQGGYVLEKFLKCS